MARLRTIKPGFFLNDELAEVAPLGRLLFAGLWCVADREGRLEDRPKKIKAEVLPYDDCNMDRLLTQLAAHGFIRRYEVSGERYIQIIHFARHQSPHLKEAPSEIPAPDEHQTSPVLVPDEHSSFRAVVGSCLGSGDLGSGALGSGVVESETEHLRHLSTGSYAPYGVAPAREGDDHHQDEGDGADDRAVPEYVSIQTQLESPGTGTNGDECDDSAPNVAPDEDYWAGPAGLATLEMVRASRRRDGLPFKDGPATVENVYGRDSPDPGRPERAGRLMVCKKCRKARHACRCPAWLREPVELIRALKPNATEGA